MRIVGPQLFRFYLDQGVTFEAALAELGCGTGLSVLYYWAAGFQQIRATDKDFKTLQLYWQNYKTLYESDKWKRLARSVPVPSVERLGWVFRGPFKEIENGLVQTAR